jgi:hypothetical protein
VNWPAIYPEADMTNPMRWLRLAIILSVTLGVGAATVTIPTRAHAPARPFSEAEVFVELNDTDGDLGLHASIDGEPWTDLEIEGPHERTLLDIASRNRLRSQGLTQLSFESAEPGFDELSPAAFFRRFPQGRYEIEARAQDGATLVGAAHLSHVLAAPPGDVRVSGQPAAEGCDARPLPKAVTPVLITWDPVTSSHPEIGESGPVTISRYQFFVEREGLKLSIDLAPAVTRFEIPASVTAIGKLFKFEIIARTSRGNNTAIESCFELD